MRDPRARFTLIALLSAAMVQGQVVPPGFNRPDPTAPKQQPQQQQPPAAQPAKPTPVPAQTPAQPTTTPAAPAPQTTTTTTPAPASTTPETPAPRTGGLSLQNASLVEVIDILARQLKINYILDPSVKGGVTINTYGETKLDNRALLDLILRINGYTMVQVGDLFRIVPAQTGAQRLPITPEVNAKPAVEDDRTMLNFIFLRYATVDDLSKLLNDFVGEYAKTWSYPAANLLVVQDSRRNMKRLLDLIALFDNENFAGQRIKLFEVKNSRPSELAKEMEVVFKSISLNDKSSPIRFLPLDRINTLIAVAPNPGAFSEVEKWLARLDVTVKSAAGSVDNYVYRVRYGRAETLGMAIMQLYGGLPPWAMMGMFGGGAYPGAGMFGSGGMYTSGMGGMGMGGMGMGMGGMGMGGGYGGGYGGGMGGMYGGGMGYGGGGYASGMYGLNPTPPQYGTAGLGLSTTLQQQGSVAQQQAAAPFNPSADLTGQYLGAGGAGGQQQRIPRVIPNPMDNTLLIQATGQEYQQILRLLKDLDIPPRQVLIEAKIYEVDLSGAFASGVNAYFQERGGAAKLGTRSVTGSVVEGVTNLSAGMLVGQSRELLAFLQLREVSSRARVISAPKIIATDSIPASINVGTEVPTLTAQALTGAQSGGNSLFANSISNRNTGVTLNILARVNPTGIVTMVVNQEVSAPIAPDAGGIQSPSFSKRTIQTQLTMDDGDTIAIGGIINENVGSSSAGIPGLHRIPILGAAFGSRSYTKQRTELIIFLTPRVIYDMNDLVDAAEELKSQMRKVSKIIEE